MSVLGDWERLSIYKQASVQGTFVLCFAYNIITIVSVYDPLPSLTILLNTKYTAFFKKNYA